MDEISMMFPVLPGKREALVAFANTLMRERKAELDIAQGSVQVENWYLQPTPFGDFVVVHFVAPSVPAVFAALAVDTGEFETWYRAQILDITGIDLANPPGELPARIFQWRKADA